MKNKAALLIAVILLSPPLKAALIVLDTIIAVVDEDVVMRSELDARRKSIQAQLISAQQQVPPDDVMNSQILERLVVESLQLQMADRAGVRISDEEVNGAMNGIAQQNSMTLAQFKGAIENDGISYVDMREQIRREMAMSRVQQGVMRRRIQVSEQEVVNFLESELGETITADEFRLGHILLPLPEKANAEQILQIKNETQALIDKIKDGADFQSLAVEKSAGQHALEGGDLGWRKAAQLPTMFSDIAQEMEPGDVRGPIKSGSGYHIITLLQKRGARAEGQVSQTQVRHILIQKNEIRTDQEAKEFAESLREEIVGGRDFDEVAKLYSDDPGSALSGGDLGWNRADTFVPEFERQMHNTPIDEISQVFLTSHGYHFLQVTGRRVEDFSEKFRMGQAENYLRNQRFDEELEAWIREIRDDAFVEIRI